ncbi:MAG TPA: alpha-amylase, partial [Treponema sp.]|nr:alpha-amylase [Treponema sp.]
QMVSRSIAEGLGLTWGDDHFCIFREHTSGLWYVRSSNDIIEHGMFVSLNGFEYQVYLDVQQVVDDEDKRYSKLCQLLNGRGVEDLIVAWQEYEYKDLYASLASFVTPKFFEDIATLYTPHPLLKSKKQKALSPAQFLDSVKEQALAYYEKEAEFAQKEAQKTQSKVKEPGLKSSRIRTKSLTQKETRNYEKSQTATAQQRYAAFCKQIEYLASTVANAQGDATAPTNAKPKPEHSAFKTTFDNLLYEGLRTHQNAAELLSSFASVSSAGKENCIKWGYDRKLTELMREAGIDLPSARDILKRLFVMMRVRDYNFGTSGAVKSTYETSLLLVEGDYAQLLTGANEFNGIRWFNKERMDETLWYGFAAVVMYSPRILREQIYRLYRTLYAAKEKAEYQCQKFTDALKPASLTKRSTKTSTAKKSAKKTSTKKTSTKTSAKGSTSSKRK